LEAILVVGGTGAGKSTIINSLLYGPHIIQRGYRGEGYVIKEEYAKIIGDRLKIGDSISTSMTFLPEQTDDFLKEGVKFIDLAGILDTRTPNYDVVNGMITGYILKQLKSARILLVTSKNEALSIKG